MRREVVLFSSLTMACAALGFYLGRQTAEPEVRTVVVEREKRETQVKVDEKKKITKYPDGKVVTEIDRKTDKKIDEKNDRKVDHSVAKKEPQWSVGLYSTMDLKVAATLDRRIVGPVFLGSYLRVDTRDPRDVEFGLGVRLEF